MAGNTCLQNKHSPRHVSPRRHPITQELGIGNGALEVFANRAEKLSAKTLNDLARYLFEASYDADLDLLVAKPKPAPFPLDTVFGL